jgi:hypothetical protein
MSDQPPKDLSTIAALVFVGMILPLALIGRASPDRGRSPDRLIGSAAKGRAGSK